MSDVRERSLLEKDYKKVGHINTPGRNITLFTIPLENSVEGPFTKSIALKGTIVKQIVPWALDHKWTSNLPLYRPPWLFLCS
jgi:hypothetical protein